MTLASFKRRVAAFLNRAPSSFQANGVDEILEALNDVRRNAQLSYSFNALKTSCFMSFGTGAVDFTSAGHVAQDVLSAVVPLKELEAVYDVGYARRHTLLPALEYNGSNGLNSTRTKINFFTEGQTVWAPAVDTPTWFQVRGFRMLPDLTNNEPSDGAQDLFLNRGSSWAVLATAQLLNFTLKEDERVGISAAVVRGTWDAFVFWDSRDSVTVEHNLD
jgi:hypothetical protein